MNRSRPPGVSALVILVTVLIHKSFHQSNSRQYQRKRRHHFRVRIGLPVLRTHNAAKHRATKLIGWVSGVLSKLPLKLTRVRLMYRGESWIRHKRQLSNQSFKRGRRSKTFHAISIADFQHR